MRKVLIADDDPTLAGMYKAQLEEEFFEVVLAADGEEALEVAHRERPDIILLDVLMPKKTGEEVIIELKNDPATVDIPVIILTNLGGKITSANDAEEFGADDFIIKSESEPRAVVNAIKKVLEKRGI
jgi:CheY-like chemotaxis protein